MWMQFPAPPLGGHVQPRITIESPPSPYPGLRHLPPEERDLRLQRQPLRAHVVADEFVDRSLGALVAKVDAALPAEPLSARARDGAAPPQAIRAV